MKIQETDCIYTATIESLHAFNRCYAYPREGFDIYNIKPGQLGNAISNYGNYTVNLIIPTDNKEGYELIYDDMNFELDDTDLDDEDKSLFHEIWACTKEHYELTTATAAATGLQIPIRKKTLGYNQALGGGKYTNLISHTGHKISPLLVFKQKNVAKVAKSLLGTTRVFGVIGRAMPWTAAVLAVVDIAAISYFTYEKNQ